MNELSNLGFDPFFRDQVSGGDIVARIAAEHRTGYEVWSGEGAGPAKLSGRLVHGLTGEAFPGVGDWVVLRSLPTEDRTAIVERVLTRRTVFIRGAAGRQARGQVVAANIDVVFVVCGLDNDYNLRRIERYLARVWASGAVPVIVLNKSDVCEDTDARRAEVAAASIGVDVIAVSALRSEGVDALRSHVQQGTTAAFVGSSGAGKSTLINALLGEERMATRKTRARDGRGCHTTTHRQMIRLPGGGLLVDTPGMRELQLFDEEGIDAVFRDIEELSAGCRFRDCGHTSEPGCAVRQAAEAGELPAERLEHYHKMQQEARAYALRHDEHARRKAERVWGQLYDEVARLRKWKQGG